MTRIPDWLVEKVHLGEASDVERALVQADPDARARLEALPTQDIAFFAAHPVEQEWPQIEARARIARARDESRANRATVASVVFAPLLAVMIALLWVGPMAEMGGDPSGIEPTTAKGEVPPKLRVYRKRATGTERIATGTVARKGDALRLETVANKPVHGVVVSIDGRGSVTLHWPLDAAGATDLDQGANLLPDAYTLDDAPKFERFFLVTTGQAPTDVSTVVHAAEALAAQDEARAGDLAVPKSYDQTSFLVVKEVQ